MGGDGFHSVEAKPPAFLLGRVGERIRLEHQDSRTEELYWVGIGRFDIFHGKRHPSEFGPGEVEALRTSLAIEGRAAASTQSLANGALLLGYKEVPGTELSWLDGVRRVKAPARRAQSTAAPTRR